MGGLEPRNVHDDQLAHASRQTADQLGHDRVTIRGFGQRHGVHVQTHQVAIRAGQSLVKIILLEDLCKNNPSRRQGT